MQDVAEYDWEQIRDALSAYAEWLTENEPNAVNTISTFERAADECPMSDDFA